MFRARILLRIAILFAIVPASITVHAERRTVCTITVNSDDEREVLRRTLPASDYDFVELVEHGRADWLRGACERDVRCDVLLISGHFDGGTEFYTDRVDLRESLPVEEMERVACSESCPGLFTHLREVYLMGCNTLDSAPFRTASGEVVRSLAANGATAVEAQRMADALTDVYGESNRERLRHVFKDVPVLYGFPGKAPLGRYAGPTLERYLRAGGEFGEGRVSAKLLAAFAPSGMIAVAGMRDDDPRASFRRDMCRLLDDRLPAPRKAAFLHEVLSRSAADVRMFLDHIERYASRPAASEAAEEMAAETASIARDGPARDRFLAIARDADDPTVGVRMARLAVRLGWIGEHEQRDMVAELLARRMHESRVGAADVDLACAENRDGSLDAYAARWSSGGARDVAGAALLACLGDTAARTRVLRALVSGDASDVTVAMTYLARRPLADAFELRAAVAGVARMRGDAGTKVRALHALARHEVTDRESLELLAETFRAERSLDVQRAIAGVFVNADYREIAPAAVARILKTQRVRSPEGRDLIDVAIRRLDTAAAR